MYRVRCARDANDGDGLRTHEHTSTFRCDIETGDNDESIGLAPDVDRVCEDVPPWALGFAASHHWARFGSE